MSDDCCTWCLACDGRFCRDTQISPGEIHGLCPACWETSR